LFDTPETLQASGETFYGYFVEEELAGVISYKKDKNILDIHRLVVHPSYFRKGIAGSLLQFIQEREPVIQKIIVSTGAKNEPAITLYQKHGFVEARTMEVADGVFITCLCKEKREFV
jgi:ribosomal protein S18 acetylase RimI-like enzyme